MCVERGTEPVEAALVDDQVGVADKDVLAPPDRGQAPVGPSPVAKVAAGREQRRPLHTVGGQGRPGRVGVSVLDDDQLGQALVAE
jgi:hypothetical protein